MTAGPGFFTTFLYYFVGTTLIVAVVSSQGIDLDLASADPYRIGIPFGLAAGLIGAYFNRSETVLIPFKNKKTFTKELAAALTELGFQEATQLEAGTVYQRPALSKFFSGQVLVQIEKDSATIAGRSSIIRALRKRL